MAVWRMEEEAEEVGEVEEEEEEGFSTFHTLEMFAKWKQHSQWVVETLWSTAAAPFQPVGRSEGHRNIMKKDKKKKKKEYST